MPDEGAPKFNVKDNLVRLKRYYSDEIPVKVLHSNMPDNKFKVRRNWFQGVVGNLEIAVLHGKIKDPKTKEEIQKFLEYAVSDTFADKPLTEQSDIDWANRIIDLALESLPN